MQKYMSPNITLADEEIKQIIVPTTPSPQHKFYDFRATSHTFRVIRASSVGIGHCQECNLGVA